jgi:hypothetical protein
MDLLPNELFPPIMKHLRQADIGALSAVCKRIRILMIEYTKSCKLDGSKINDKVMINMMRGWGYVNDITCTNAIVTVDVIGFMIPSTIHHVHFSNCSYIKSICPIFACNTIRTISFSYCKGIFDKIYGKVDCPKLHTVNIADCGEMRHEFSGVIACCPAIESVNLSGCQSNVPGFVIQKIAECPKLRSINFSRWRGIHTLKDLPLCSTLLSADFSEVDLSDKSIRGLSKCVNLQVINLRYCRNLTDDTVQKLSACSDLQEVNFGYCYKLTNNAVKHLLVCKKLISVNFDGCSNLTDDAIKMITSCIPNPTIQYISFGDCTNLTDNACYCVIDSAIVYAHFFECPNIISRDHFSLVCPAIKLNF